MLALTACSLGDVGPDLKAYEAEKAAALAQGDGASGDTKALDAVPTDASGSNPGDAKSGDSHDTGAEDTATPDDASSKDGASLDSGNLPETTASDATGGDTAEADAQLDAGPAKCDKNANCDDTNPCTVDSCVAQKCEYSATKGAQSCDDNDACTFGDLCKDTVCLAGAATKCDDGNTCTADACLPASGCTATNDDQASCDDGSVCSTAQACKDGLCAATAALDCADNDPCTADSCHPVAGCKHGVAADATPCDDGAVCTTVDECQDGKCVGLAGLWSISPKPLTKSAHLTGAVGAVGDHRILTHTIAANVGSQPAFIGELSLFDAAGRLQAALPVPSPITFVQRIVKNKDGSALALGQVVSPGHQIRLIALDVGPKALKISNDSTVGTWGSFAADIVPAGAEWQVYGRREPAGQFSEAVIARVKANGDELAFNTHVRKLGSSLHGATAAHPGTATHLGCGNVTWSKLGHTDAWIVATDKAGNPVWERTYDWETRDLCRAIATVDNGYILVGQSDTVRFVSSGRVQKIDTAGRVRWSRLIAGDIGADLRRISVTAGDHVVIGGHTEAIISGDRSSQAHLWDLSAATGQTRWQVALGGKGPGTFGDLFVDDDGKVVVVGELHKAGFAGNAMLKRLGRFGHEDCKAAGKCAEIAPTKCVSAGQCELLTCVAANGCTALPTTAWCDDGLACSVGAKCKAGKCEGGKVALWQRKFGKGEKTNDLAPDGSGGWLLGVDTEFKANRVDAAGDVAGTIFAYSNAYLMRRIGPVVEIASGIDAEVRSTFVDAVSFKEPVAGPFFSATTADLLVTLPHDEGDYRRARVRCDGRRCATARTASTPAVKLHFSVSPGGDWDQAHKEIEVPLSKSLALGQAGHEVVSADLGADPNGGWYAAATLHKDDNGAKTLGVAARLYRIGDDAKLNWQRDWTATPAKFMAMAVGLVATRNGDVVYGVYRQTLVGTPADTAFDFVRVSDANKELWKATVQSANPDFAWIPMLELDHGAVLAAAALYDGNNGVQQLLRVNATGVTAKHKLPAATAKARPIAIATDVWGNISVLTKGAEIELLRVNPWLHTTCNEAGKCGDETLVTCEDPTVCASATCDAKSGCTATNAADATACDDGNPCLSGGSCKTGKCVNTKTLQCNDNVACSTDRCDPGSGSCVSSAEDGACFKVDPCNTFACTNAGCKATPLPDGTACGDKKTCKSGACVQ